MPSRTRQLVKRVLTGTVPRAALLASGPRLGQVCLTFDDGPDPEHTPRVLDELWRLGLRATFFVVGKRAVLHPALVQRIVDEGHLLANHSFYHGPPGTTGALELASEVQRTRALLSELVGRAPNHFRPPQGKLTAAKLIALWSLRQSIVLWNVDPKDFACRGAYGVSRFFDARPLRGGDLVLLHDTCSGTLAALPEVVGVARSQGLAFVTVDAWTGRRSER